MPDFSVVYAGATWLEVAFGLDGVAAAVVTLYLAWKGARVIAAALKGV